MPEEELTVKVILTEDITPLGAMGAVVDVARGYARNYLIPQGKAMEATPGNLAQVEAAKAKYTQMQAKAREAAMVQVAHLDGASVTIAQRVGEEERLYGSVTAAMIAEALEGQGFAVDKKQLDLPEPIKKLGTYEVTVRLAPEVKATVTVAVVPESASKD
jgi:large subunit ribosomal protein L9